MTAAGQKGNDSSPPICASPPPISVERLKATHNGRSASAAGTAVHAPVSVIAERTAEPPSREGKQKIRRRSNERFRYSMTSSARASSAAGIVRPSAAAVFRLTTSSNFMP